MLKENQGSPNHRECQAGQTNDGLSENRVLALRMSPTMPMVSHLSIGMNLRSSRELEGRGADTEGWKVWHVSQRVNGYVLKDTQRW